MCIRKLAVSIFFRRTDLTVWLSSPFILSYNLWPSKVFRSTIIVPSRCLPRVSQYGFEYWRIVWFTKPTFFRSEKSGRWTSYTIQSANILIKSTQTNGQWHPVYSFLNLREIWMSLPVEGNLHFWYLSFKYRDLVFPLRILNWFNSIWYLLNYVLALKYCHLHHTAPILSVPDFRRISGDRLKPFCIINIINHFSYTFWSIQKYFTCR